MAEMSGIQGMIYDELQQLLAAVEVGKFGKGNNFDRDAFEAEFDDEVLIICYAYEKESNNTRG